MKLRSGFVSNSSSASFIVTAFDGDEQTVEEALLEQFEYSLFESETSKRTQFGKLTESLGISYSKSDDCHTFEYTTSMYNDLNDMSENLFKIYAALKFSRIKCNLKIQDDN